MLSNVRPIFPAGTFQWSDRVDNVNIDFANDINSTVAEIESIETVLGSNPQVEPLPPTGLPVSYPTVSARISDAMTGNNMPFCSLIAASQVIPNYGAAWVAHHTASLDPYGCYNGTDITIPVNGWWQLEASAEWPWNDTGYVAQYLTLFGSTYILDEEIFNWQFPANLQSLGTALVPRFVLNGKPIITTKVSFMGALHKGDRITNFLENGTSTVGVTVNAIRLKATLMRTIPSTITFTSG